MQQVNFRAISHTDYSASFNGSIFSEIPTQSLCLDVGCSSGNLGAELIAYKGCRVQGIDINPDALSQATQKGYEQVYALDLIRDHLRRCFGAFRKSRIDFAYFGQQTKAGRLHDCFFAKCCFWAE
jgi:SAM-dependent methyltransferase